MAMNSRFYWLIVILILGSIAMGACTAPPAPAIAPAATPTPKPTVTGPGGFPLGKYVPNPVHDVQYMLFTAQGTFVLEMSADPDLGHYVVNGDQIVLNIANGICFNHPGTYHWEIHGNTLTLKPINETCTDSDRAEDLGGRSWILQP